MADPDSRDDLNAGMAPGSDLIVRLDQALPDLDYELVCYGRVGDAMVGLERTAPPGETIHWVPNPPFEPAHLLAFGDRRLLADVARRLRDETPYATDPQTPIPSDD